MAETHGTWLFLLKNDREDDKRLRSESSLRGRFLPIFQEVRIVCIAAPFIDYVLAWNLTKDVQLAGHWPLA